jgi:predicted small metal-binding protein
VIFQKVLSLIVNFALLGELCAFEVLAGQCEQDDLVQGDCVEESLSTHARQQHRLTEGHAWREGAELLL